MLDDPRQDNDLPASLLLDISELFGHAAAIPAETDAAILANLRRRAAHIRRMRMTLRWTGVAAAIAAILLVAFHLWPASKPIYRPGATVTILDAYSLARQLKTNATPDESWDVNHDGVVDQKDVDQIAGQAVSLTRSTR